MVLLDKGLAKEESPDRSALRGTPHRRLVDIFEIIKIGFPKENAFMACYFHPYNLTNEKTLRSRSGQVDLMNFRERVRALELKVPDWVPITETGFRPETLERWHREGLPEKVDPWHNLCFLNPFKTLQHIMMR